MHASATNTVVVNKPLSTTFAFFADAENDPTWRSGVTSIVREGALGVGAVYHQTIAGPMGRAIAADIRVTAYDPEARVAFETISGPVRPNGEYVFEAVGDTTRVTFNLEATVEGLKALAMGGMVQKTMSAEVAALAKAKAVLEAS